MAIGDRAAAAGLVVYPSTQALNKGFENDNQRGDELADEKTARVAGDAARLVGTVSPTEPAGTPEGHVWIKA